MNQTLDDQTSAPDFEEARPPTHSATKFVLVTFILPMIFVLALAAYF